MEKSALSRHEGTDQWKQSLGRQCARPRDSLGSRKRQERMGWPNSTPNSNIGVVTNDPASRTANTGHKEDPRHDHGIHDSDGNETVCASSFSNMYMTCKSHTVQIELHASLPPGFPLYLAERCKLHVHIGAEPHKRLIIDCEAEG